MVEVAEVLDGVLSDSEGELLGRLTLLADENQAHKKTLEAAKSLIHCRRDLDDVIGQPCKMACNSTANARWSRRSFANFRRKGTP